MRVIRNIVPVLALSAGLAVVASTDSAYGRDGSKILDGDNESSQKKNNQRLRKARSYWAAPPRDLGLKCIDNSINVGKDDKQESCLTEGQALCIDYPYQSYPYNAKSRPTPMGPGRWTFGIQDGRIRLWDPRNNVVWEHCADVTHLCIGEDTAESFSTYSNQRPFMHFYNEKTNKFTGRLVCDGTDGRDASNLNKQTLLKMVDHTDMEGPYVDYPVTLLKFRKGQTEDRADDNYLWKIVYDPTNPQLLYWDSTDPLDASAVTNRNKCRWVDTCGPQPVGNVFTMVARGQGTGGNSISTYTRYEDGTLTYLGAVPTGGYGTRTSTGSQGLIYLMRGSEYLLACNTGSGTFSILRLAKDNMFATLPSLVGSYSSMGDFPNSIAQSPTNPELIYVLNAASSGSVQGFRFEHNTETLTHIGGSSLFQGQTGFNLITCPSQVGFDPLTGRLVTLVKINRANNNLGPNGRGLILVYNITMDGMVELSDSYVRVPSLPTPFSFDFNENGYLATSDFFSASSSSYTITGEGKVENITEGVSTFERGACWNVFARGHNYVVNQGSDSISSFSIDIDGKLALAASISGEANAENGMLSQPIDIAASTDEKYLYVINSDIGSVSAFEVAGLEDGGLKFIQSLSEGLYPRDSANEEVVLGMAAT